MDGLALHKNLEAGAMGDFLTYGTAIVRVCM